jgi:diamine N-acetyltransferase
MSVSPRSPYVLDVPGPGDAPALTALAAATFRETYAVANDPAVFDEYVARAFTVESFARALADPRCEVHWLLNDGEPVGYVRLNLAGAQTEPDLGGGLEVQQIYVLAEHQGHGLGGTLVGLAVEAARRHRLGHVWLGVWERNDNAIGFYRRHGFEPFGEHVFRLGDEEQRDLLMRRDLGDDEQQPA